MRTSDPGNRGFTLIEVVVVLAVVALLLGLLAPMAFQLFTAERSTAIQTEVQTIYRAIVGDPKQGVFGFVGDVGSFPTNLLDLIVAPAGKPGWKGPYLQNPRIENGILLDTFGRPYEYFLQAITSGPDHFAIISRGPDGLSTNAAANPNRHGVFVGPTPLDATYFSTGGNPDNVVFPQPTDGNPNALDIETEGGVAFNILNFDANPKLNAFVPACPGLFTIAPTSIPRGQMEPGFPLAFKPGLRFNLTQGQYRVDLTPKSMAATSWSETITVLPASTLTRTINLTGLDSSGTPLFTLTVVNGFTNLDVEVFEFDKKLKATDGKEEVKAGQTKVFTPHACAQIFIRQDDRTTVLDQFVMPFNAFTRRLGTGTACLTVINNHHHPDDADHPHDVVFHHHHHVGHHRELVFVNDILIGTVKHDRRETFCDLNAGDVVKITDKNGVILMTLTLVAGSQTVTPP